MAERQGFEPWIGVTYTHFPGVRLQPLGHLSEQMLFVFFQASQIIQIDNLAIFERWTTTI